MDSGTKGVYLKKGGGKMINKEVLRAAGIPFEGLKKMSIKTPFDNEIVEKLDRIITLLEEVKSPTPQYLEVTEFDAGVEALKNKAFCDGYLDQSNYEDRNRYYIEDTVFHKEWLRGANLYRLHSYGE